MSLAPSPAHTTAGVSTACPQCSFELWTPLAHAGPVLIGLYDDGRFPGRLIVSLSNHYDHLDDVPPDEVSSFMLSIQDVMRAQRTALNASRINVAVLGNQVAHVHAHLIPRRSTDARPMSAPWEDPRPRQRLGVPAKDDILARLSTALTTAGFPAMRGSV